MRRKVRARAEHAAPAARADPAGRKAEPLGDRWVVGFVARLLAGWALAIGLLAVAPGIERWAVMSTVGSVGGALQLASLDPTITGTTITLDQAALRIIPECTPLMPGLLLAIAVAAYPAAFRWKLAGITVGIAVLWLFNLVRMLALMAVLVRWPGSFKFVHVYLWQSMTLLVVSALFLAWLRWEPSRPAEA